jgi:UDP-N-acetyl-D-mannosaminuronic acid dehydrogenase
MMNCEQYGANVFEVIDLINRDYPRGGIAMPGLTGGTCLRKDFAFSEERSSAPGMLMAVSRVNESVPLFLVEGIKSRLGTLKGKKVTVLGLTFKRNSDDLRDSLALKLVRLLERELADVATHDPHAPTATDSLEEALAGANAVVVATNHDEFADPKTLNAIIERAGRETLVVDPWNVFGAARAFANADEVAAHAGRSFAPAAGMSIEG